MTPRGGHSSSPSSAQESGTSSTVQAPRAQPVVETVTEPPSKADSSFAGEHINMFLLPASDCTGPPADYSSPRGFLPDSPLSRGPASSASHLTFLDLSKAVFDDDLLAAVTESGWVRHRLDPSFEDQINMGITGEDLWLP
jgi:hypothetical protein